MTYIKPDPDMQEEQEDLIMSYLNADYLSTDATPLSPPSSTSSYSDTTGSPEKHSVDDFMLDMNSTDFLNHNDHWTTNTENLFNPCFPQQDLLGGFPFFLSQTTTTAPTSPPQQVLATNFVQPFLSSSSTGSLSDSEQPKKKRGRKKREPTIQNTLPIQPSLLAPKPLAPKPNAEIIKMEPDIIEVAGPLKNETIEKPQTQEAQKAAQIQKRQERLIKNRAAALLSRKRKREHLSCLEEEKQLLVLENENLLNKVVALENRVSALEKENLDLKQHLQLTTNPTSTVINIGTNKRPLINNTKSSKATGVVFMVIK